MPSDGMLLQRDQKLAGIRPGTTRTFRGAAIQIAAIDTQQHPIVSQNANL